ncbi:MAG: hypothetical protein MJZ65_03385 [Paludibacteraceae bacterium]|nr:hypothetical protein [Paludibacteraceae bacterium]
MEDLGLVPKCARMLIKVRTTIGGERRFASGSLPNIIKILQICKSFCKMMYLTATLWLNDISSPLYIRLFSEKDNIYLHIPKILCNFASKTVLGALHKITPPAGHNPAKTLKITHSGRITKYIYIDCKSGL